MIKEKSITTSLLVQAHGLVASVLKAGDAAVDATLGNGHDALFLAQCVGSSGMVFGFDVQQEALNNTRERFESAGVDRSCYQLISESHASVAQYVEGKVNAVMFNLGYLPGGDKTKITHGDSTLAALSASLDLMAAGGILTVMCYPGHDGGADEARLVNGFINELDRSNLDRSKWAVTLYNRLEASDSSPYLWVVMNGKAEDAV